MSFLCCKTQTKEVSDCSVTDGEGKQSEFKWAACEGTVDRTWDASIPSLLVCDVSFHSPEQPTALEQPALCWQHPQQGDAVSKLRVTRSGETQRPAQPNAPDPDPKMLLTRSLRRTGHSGETWI